MIPPNRVQIRRELGETAAIFVNEAEKGTLFEYIERHKVPAADRRRRRDEVNDIPSFRALYDAEIWAVVNPPLWAVYEIIVNGEYYGTTSTLEFQRIVDMYPKFRQLWWQEKVDIIQTNSNKLIYSNYQKTKDDDTE